MAFIYPTQTQATVQKLGVFWRTEDGGYVRH